MTYSSEPSWKFKAASVMNGTNNETVTEGFLVVTVVGSNSQVEKNGTVCDLNWHSANLVCQSLGFMFADWGRRSKNLKNNPK